MFAGVAFFLARIIDGLGDVVAGLMSDRHRGRLGPRLPFILAAALPLCFGFILLWLPPIAGSSVWNAVWVLVISSLFFTAFSFTSGPYRALLPDLSSDLTARTRLAQSQGVFFLMGTAAALVAVAWLVGRFGYLTMAVIVGPVAAALYVVAALSVWRRAVQSTPAPVPKTAMTAAQYLRQLTDALRHSQFRAYVLAKGLLTVGYSLTLLGLPYLVTIRMGRSEADITLLASLGLIITLASFPLLGRLVQRFGVRALFLACMWSFTLPLIAWYFVGSPAVPANPFLFGTAVAAVTGFPIAALIWLPNLLVAEVSDTLHSERGESLQATLYGLEGLVTKVAVAISALVGGITLDLFGASAQASQGIALLGPVAALFVAAGCVTFLGYRPKADKRTPYSEV